MKNIINERVELATAENLETTKDQDEVYSGEYYS